MDPILLGPERNTGRPSIAPSTMTVVAVAGPELQHATCGMQDLDAEGISRVPNVLLHPFEEGFDFPEVVLGTHPSPPDDPDSRLSDAEILRAALDEGDDVFESSQCPGVASRNRPTLRAVVLPAAPATHVVGAYSRCSFASHRYTMCRSVVKLNSVVSNETSGLTAVPVNGASDHSDCGTVNDGVSFNTGFLRIALIDCVCSSENLWSRDSRSLTSMRMDSSTAWN